MSDIQRVNSNSPTAEQRSFLGRVLRFCMVNKLVVALLLLFAVGAGWYCAPFDWEAGGIERKPVAVDAIPDLGENQQIVFTEWQGHSPQDIEDQMTYPLTVALLGVPGVKTIRSNSFFGFSSVYVIFKEDVEYYWSRSRILEKLNSLPENTLPEGVRPALGPDATALGQVFWYTLEGQDKEGNPAGGWDLEELRTVQDFYVKYGLMAAGGVSEVASVGGYVKEYQVDIDPDAMRAYQVTFSDIYKAVKGSNLDVGAKTVELNRVEHFVRGVGFIKKVGDIEESVVKVVDHVPVLVKHVATVTIGPAMRRGALDKDGAQAVGGVVVARYGDNPLEVIKNVQKTIDEITPGLPAKVIFDFDRVGLDEVRDYAIAHGFQAYVNGEVNHRLWLAHLDELAVDKYPAWVTVSQVAIVPFYDRTGLIYETLGTLKTALEEEVMITLIVVILMVMHLRSSILIGGLLPIAVLMCFVAMKLFKVDANIVALSGIAIAIGTMVDMGIVICENILRHLDEAREGDSRLEVIHRAASEVGGAVLTAVLTTVVSFLPVFMMIGPEGKLFKPLAYTKTFALIASVLVALMMIPPAAHLLFGLKIPGRKLRFVVKSVLLVAVLFWVGVVLSKHWSPVGPDKGVIRNCAFVGGLVVLLLGFFWLFRMAYPAILGWCLRHKFLFMLLPTAIVVMGVTTWLGFDKVMTPAAHAVGKIGLNDQTIKSSTFWVNAQDTFPGLGKEFMPSLDEGSFLYMPTTMVHASIGEALDVLSKQDRAIRAIPEVAQVVGKIGRAETPLDPAPVSMVETVINYKPEYISDKNGRRVNFRYDREEGYVRDDFGELIEDADGRPYRQWRDSIKTADDIWDAIEKAARVPGSTSAPKLQPIATRLIMLQTGMRAPMGVKVKGPTLEAIERAGLEIERLLKDVPGVNPAAVFADRIVGKPYLEIEPDREALGRYGVQIQAFQDVVVTAIGGRRVTTTVEGRQRFGVRVRYQRELRDQIETMGRILVPASDGTQIPLGQLATIRFRRGPQMIKSEDTSLIGYVLFDKKPGTAEVDVVEACQKYLDENFTSPAGVSYRFAGNYENQIRSQKTLAVVLPVALFAIFLILYFQFKSVVTTALIFSGIAVAWSGGFIMLWLYGQDWFLNVSVFGIDLQELFQIHPINLSVAVWVGFLALFGIATDDGVVVGTYLAQSFRDGNHETVSEIRQAVLAAGGRRIRACLMTTATTILALLPILTSTGRGADVMIPMAIPSFGGMTIAVLTMLVVPVLYCAVQEFKKHTRLTDGPIGAFVIVTGFLGFIPILLYCGVVETLERIKSKKR